MNPELMQIPRQPVLRSQCLDCQAVFARHRAVQRSMDTIARGVDADTLVCPECGSQAVEEAAHEQL